MCGSPICPELAPFRLALSKCSTVGSRAARDYQRAPQVQTIPVGDVSHIIYPHVLFSWLFSKFGSAFTDHMAGSGLVEFWRGFLSTPYGTFLHETTPCLRGKTAAQLTKTVPLILHGDGVPYATKQSATFVQFGSLIG